MTSGSFLSKRTCSSVRMLKFSRFTGISVNMYLTQNEPRPEISNTVVFATSLGSDKPAHTYSPIRAFANRLNIL